MCEKYWKIGSFKHCTNIYQLSVSSAVEDSLIEIYLSGRKLLGLICMSRFAYKQHDSIYIELCLWLPPKVAMIGHLLKFQFVMEKLPTSESATSDEWRWDALFHHDRGPWCPDEAWCGYQPGTFLVSDAEAQNLKATSQSLELRSSKYP